MNDQLTWSRVRQDTIERFNGELPRADTEAAIITVFEVTPTAVIKAIDRIATAYNQGKIRSPWAVLKADLQGAADPLREATVQAPNKRAAALQLAETWVRNTGYHYATSNEVLDELFTNQQGRLHEWATDTTLRHHIADLWEQQRPRGIATDEDEERRAAAYRERQKAVRITDADSGRRIVTQLAADNVPLPIIEKVIRRGIPNTALQAELVDQAADIRRQTDNASGVLSAEDLPAARTGRTDPPR